MYSIGQRLVDTSGRPSGFDYMRIVLSIMVVVVHSIGTSYGLEADKAFFQSEARGGVRLILPMFFALSGFLVAGSLLRTRTIGMFLGLRVIRIYPALVVEVLLAALIVGPLLTTVSLGEYFSSPVFHRYLLNATGHISYALPGVFESNPQPATVNSQLWTVPFELFCYVSLLVLVLMGGRRWKIVYPLAALVLSIGHFAFRYSEGTLSLMPSGPVSGTLLVVSFLVGVSIYMYRDQIVFSASLFWLSLAVSVILLAYVPGGDYLAQCFVGYSCVYIGLTNFRRIRLIDGADYSYGVFLYGFVVQQALMDVVPWARHWYLNTIFSLAVVVMFAAFSWHCVEKPALKLKKVLARIEDYLVSRVRSVGRAA